MATAAPPQLPAAAEALGAAAERETFVAACGLLFEPAPVLVDALLAQRPFATYTALIDAAARQLGVAVAPAAAATAAAAAAAAASDPAVLSRAERVDIVNAHPRIGMPAAALSALSRAEQGGGGDGDGEGDGDDGEAAAAALRATMDALADLNARYEARFGFKFVVFVNGRSRAEIVPVLRACVEDQAATADSELARGLAAMMDIARDRLRKLEGPAAVAAKH